MPVRGSDNVIRALLAVQAKFNQNVKEAVEINLGDMELAAIRDAPSGGDPIATRRGSESQQDIARGRNWTPISQAIGYRIAPDGLSGRVFVEQSAGAIAAFVEFGTGQSASSYLSTVDPEWKAIAQRYYINGRGTIIAKPYLYPNYLKYRIEFLNDLKKAVANHGK